MAIGLTIFLITVGAILRFGITVKLTGIDIRAIGVILMVAGAGLLVIQLVFLAKSTSSGESHERTHPDDAPPPV
jgi:uncharacterized protein DUF6458